MIVPDVTLLLYAEIDSFPHHTAARKWWEKLLSGDRAVGIAPVCLFGFLRVGTNRRVFLAHQPSAQCSDVRWANNDDVVAEVTSLVWNPR